MKLGVQIYLNTKQADMQTGGSKCLSASQSCVVQITAEMHVVSVF